MEQLFSENKNPSETLKKTESENRSEIIATVAHEFKTPLTAIGGYAQLIRSGDAGPINETQREFLDIIDQNVQRLTGLINDILNVEKLEAGSVAVQSEAQNLREILSDCRNNLLLTAQAKGLEVRLSFPETVPMILGERDKMIQIFNNLLSNAIKYTVSGFIELNVLSDTDDNSCVRIQVTDTGTGLAPSEVNQLFKKFYRTESSLASSESGTGLGLVITKKLIEAHGGTISVSSTPGEGSTFEVTFPVTTPTLHFNNLPAFESTQLKQAIAAVDESYKLKNLPEMIWIVDSNLESSEVIRQVIECGDYQGTFSANRVFRVRIFRSADKVPFLSSTEVAPAAVVFNPGASGCDVEKISDLRRKVLSHTPIIALEGAASRVDTTSLFSDGVSAIVSQPVKSSEFWNALGRFCK